MNYSGTSCYAIPFPISFMNDMTGIGGIDYAGDEKNNGIVFRIHSSTTKSSLSIYGKRILDSDNTNPINTVYGKFIIIGY